MFIVKIILVASMFLLLLFLYSACKISGDISREEEKVNEFYKSKWGEKYEKEKEKSRN